MFLNSGWNALEKRRFYHFGPFRLDAVARVLLRQDDPVHLTRKAAETLLLLVEQSPQVVTKEELLAGVWPDRVVDEANLTQNIAVIRRALNSEKGEPGYIETFPGRGYRILGPVDLHEELPHVTTVVEPAAAPAAAPPPVTEAVAVVHRRRVWPWTAVLVTAVVAVGWLLLRRGEVQPTQPHITPVTRLAGKESQPSISPDGSQVAFVWEKDSGRNPVLYLQAKDGSQPRPLTKAAGWYASPEWSPDGKWIACLRFRDTSGELVLLSVDGGPERVLSPVLPTRYGLSYRHLSWSPDGKHLVIDDAENLNEPLALFLVSLEDGHKKRLTQPGDLMIGDVDPRFSPDGAIISFLRAAHRTSQEIFTVPATGGAASQVTSDNRQISAHEWAAQPRTFVYASNRGGEFRLWRLTLGGKPTATGVYGEFPIQFALSRKTTDVVYAVIPNDPNIWRLELSATPNWKRLIASTGQDASPQYSPDGSRICFRSDRGGDEEIWVSDSEGNDVTQVTHGGLYPSVARWSPDGRRLIFNNARTQELYLAESQNGPWKITRLGMTGVHPVFAPDGKSFYGAASGAIQQYPLGGGAPHVVVPTRGLSLGLSPDGKQIYFVREPAATTLWRADLATAQMSRVLDGLVPYCTSCWAVAENGIYYLGARPGSPHQQSVFYLDFRTQATKLIADYPEPILPIGIGPFSLSKDGRYLLTVRLDPINSDLLRVDNFR
jgi:Tol biopolymer transport system component/DNA-binding winged helix-turn-helix (wHTH) protein